MQQEQACGLNIMPASVGGASQGPGPVKPQPRHSVCQETSLPSNRTPLCSPTTLPFCVVSAGDRLETLLSRLSGAVDPTGINGSTLESYNPSGENWMLAGLACSMLHRR